MTDKQDRPAEAERLKLALGHLLLVLACLLPIFYAVYAFFRMPVRYVELIAEDNIGETFTAMCFFAASIIALRIAYCRRREGKPWAILTLFGLGAFFIGGEEMSWFSRVFGYEVEFIQGSNRQNEVSIHNHYLVRLPQGALQIVIALLYGVLLPLAARLSTSFQAIGHRWGVPIPPLHAIPLFAAAAIFPLMDHFNLFPVHLDKSAEVAEMAFGLGMLVTAATFGLHWGLNTSLHAVRAMAGALFAALVLVQFGPADSAAIRRELRLVEFRDWRYINMSLRDPARELIRHYIERQRKSGLLGNGDAASYNRLALLYKLSDPERVKRPAAAAESSAWIDIALGLINASIALDHLDKKEEARRRLDEAKRLLDERLDPIRRDPERRSLLELRATVTCLEEGAGSARRFLNSERQSFSKSRRTRVLQFINQGHCRQ